MSNAARFGSGQLSSLSTRRLVIAGVVGPVLAAVFSFAWGLLLVVAGTVMVALGGAWGAALADAVVGWYFLGVYGLGIASAVIACWAVWPNRSIIGNEAFRAG